MTNTEKITILRESKKEHEETLDRFKGEVEKFERLVYLERHSIASLNRILKELENDLENDDEGGPRRF